MSNLSPEEKEKILHNIASIKEEIWETRAYISSDFCQRCSDMYIRLNQLETELEQLRSRL